MSSCPYYPVIVPAFCLLYDNSMSILIDGDCDRSEEFFGTHIHC